MKLRNSNIEILRIVGMFMIVLSHSAIQSGFKDEFSLIGLKSILLKWKELGNLGVAIFAIISVYYSAFKESTMFIVN